MIAEFIEPHDPRWRRTVERNRHDIYHLPEYTALAGTYEGGTPLAFYAEEDGAALLIPLLVRKLPRSLNAPDDWFDASTPYGYPSPVVTPEADPALLARFLEAFTQVGAANGIVTAFIRLHPLLPLPGEVLTGHGSLVRHGQTVYVDLSQSYDEMWAQTKRDHKWGIRKLGREGFRAEMDNWSAFDDFVSIYRASMSRVRASEFYLFPDSYFTDLREALGDHLHICTVISPEEEVAAAGLITEADGIVQAHLAGTADKYFKHAPAKLKYDFVRRWAKDAGHSFVLFGGGVGGTEDSLFRFKAGFSHQRADFHTYRMVLDTDKYEALIRLWQTRLGEESSVVVGNGFFPMYRNPATKVALAAMQTRAS